MSNEEFKTTVSEDFWSATIEEVKNGFIEHEKTIKCLICGQNFIIGRIYEVNSDLYDAKKTAEIHVKEAHGSMLNYLLNMNSSFTGLTQVQSDLLRLFAKGISDKDAAERLGVTSSTIRNHRYKLREKEKQARLYLAVMELLSETTNKKISMLDNGVICDPHKTATTIDDRFNIIDEEKLQVLASYVKDDGSLMSFPSKEKKKIIVLEKIMESFKLGKIYTEKEVNDVLIPLYEDYVTIRRALIEYGFLQRSKDCSKYWVKE